MKFYLSTLLILALFVQSLFAQDITIDGSKSELPKLNKESLQVETDIELYPNPAVEFLTINLKNSKLEDVQFEVYNIIGNKLSFEMDAINSNSYKINVKEFNPGYYLLIVKDPVTRYNKAFKFRKQ